MYAPPTSSGTTKLWVQFKAIGSFVPFTCTYLYNAAVVLRVSTVHKVGNEVSGSVKNTNCHGVGLVEGPVPCIAANPGSSTSVGHTGSDDSTGTVGWSGSATIPREPGAWEEKKYGGPAGAVLPARLLAGMDMSHALLLVVYERVTHCTAPGVNPTTWASPESAG